MANTIDGHTLQLVNQTLKEENSSNANFLNGALIFAGLESAV